MPEDRQSDEPSPDVQSNDGPEPVRSLSEARSVTRERIRDIQSLLKRYLQRHSPPSSPQRPDPVQEPPPRTGPHARLLPFLRLVPVVLFVLFGVSFVWDFPGRSVTLLGTSYTLEGLLRITSVSGLIGFATNWLAITMLFHPRERRPIFGQGLIPAQREHVIYRLAEAVTGELINEEMIKTKIRESQIIPRYREMALGVTRSIIEDPDFRQDMKLLVADYVERVLTSPAVRSKIIDFTIEKMEEHAGRGVAGFALRTYRFFNEDEFQYRIEQAVHELPQSMDRILDETDQFLDRLPEQLESRSADIEDWVTRLVLRFVENLNVQNIILDNMEEYDERQLEELLKRTSNEQFNYIKYLGGVLGFFGGLIIWEPLPALAAFATLGLTLYLLDVALYRKQRST